MEGSGQTPAPSPGGGNAAERWPHLPADVLGRLSDLELDRLSSALRIFWVIPIAILAATIECGSFSTGTNAQYAGGGIAVLFIPVVLMLLFRKKYPRSWYDRNLELSRFSNRIAVCFALIG